MMREKGFWPVFEGKHVEQFLVGVKPIRWWLPVEHARRKYERDLRNDTTLVFRQVASNTNERTCIAAVLPFKSAATETLTGMYASNVDLNQAAVVFNALCFDYMLRLRVAGSHVTFSQILPMPVPAASDVRHLPVLATRAAWEIGIEHITEDKALWPSVWEANRAVATAYGLNADDLRHILAAFPVMARKRPEFHAFLVSRLNEWQ
jgi:hypothetical protein